jgi:hypothetical protein
MLGRKIAKYKLRNQFTMSNICVMSLIDAEVMYFRRDYEKTLIKLLCQNRFILNTSQIYKSVIWKDKKL